VAEEAVRRSIKIPKSTDVAVRSLLAQKGLKKGDLSKFIDEAARRRVYQQTVQDARARNAGVSPAKLESIVEEALAEVRAERFGPRR
jgi:hypothetical protein